MARWEDTYDAADRTLFVGTGQKNSAGVALVDERAPFYVLRLNGKDYYETRPAVLTVAGDVGGDTSRPYGRLVGTQVIDIDSPVTYNPSGETPVFEMHPLV